MTTPPASWPTESGAPVAKGSTARGTLAYVERYEGAAAIEQVMTRLPDHVRRGIESASATDELPYLHLVELWQSIDAMLSPAQPEWAERAGAFSIDSVGVQLYGGILRKANPRAFLTQSISLFRLYYHPGDITVVEDVDGGAILRLVDFDPVTRLFCRRLTGGLCRAVELAGGESANVRHVRCSIEGDAFCEWQLEWHVPHG